MKGSFSKNALIVYKTVFKRSNHTFQPLFILIKLLQKMLVVGSGGKCSFPPTQSHTVHFHQKRFKQDNEQYSTESIMHTKSSLKERLNAKTF